MQKDIIQILKKADTGQLVEIYRIIEVILK